MPGVGQLLEPKPGSSGHYRWQPHHLQKAPPYSCPPCPVRREEASTWLQPHWSEGDSTLGWFAPPRKSLVDSSSLLLACSLSFPKSSLPTWGGGASCSTQTVISPLSPSPLPPALCIAPREKPKLHSSVPAPSTHHLCLPQGPPICCSPRTFQWAPTL